jgi:hypothetical protein
VPEMEKRSHAQDEESYPPRGRLTTSLVKRRENELLNFLVFVLGFQMLNPYSFVKLIK